MKKKESLGDIYLGKAKSKRRKDTGYLEFVAQHECLFCGKSPAGHAHHIRWGPTCGWSYKPDARRSIPLCFYHHDLIHGDPRLFHLTVPREDIWKAMFEQLLEWLDHPTSGKERYNGL